MTNHPITTLFMLTSVDGKISTGANDSLDVDKDFPSIPGVKEGLGQYYEIEQTTDLVSFNTGRCMAKVGWNEKEDVEPSSVSFVIVDNKPHLTEQGVANLINHTKKLYLVTTDKQHPATKMTDPNLEILNYEDEVDFDDLFQKLKAKGVERITIQSGGNMNAKLLRAGLIDFVSIVVAPILIGGRNTSSLIDGDSLQTVEDLKQLRALVLIKADVLKDSYLHLQYEVKK